MRCQCQKELKPASGQVHMEQGLLNVWDRQSDKNPVPERGIMQRQAPNQRAERGPNRGQLNDIVQPGELDFTSGGFAVGYCRWAEDEILCWAKLPRFDKLPSVQPTGTRGPDSSIHLQSVVTFRLIPVLTLTGSQFVPFLIPARHRLPCRRSKSRGDFISSERLHGRH